MPDASPFTPVPVASRHDGWTVDKQRRFLFALADTGCVSQAAAEVGMSPRSAYRLRRRYGAAAFSDAWDQAMQVGARRLSAIAFERAINGTEEEVWHKGEMVGTRRRYNDRLLMFLLAQADPSRYGHLAKLHPHPIRDPLQDAQNALFTRIHELRDEAETEPLVPGAED